MYQFNVKENEIITHDPYNNFEYAYETTYQRILKDGDKTDSLTNEMLQILNELAKFEFGKFLITNKGLNGKWTQYLTLYPFKKRIIEFNNVNRKFFKLESWLLERCPIILATQERYQIFQKIAQSKIINGGQFASVPCGLMDDLLSLDYSKINGFKLYGINLDSQVLIDAKINSHKYNFENVCTFIHSDAWSLRLKNTFDLVLSNGLNIYEPDDDRVTQLYKRFYIALKKGATLVTSFLTPPPSHKKKSSWNAKEINVEDLRIQKIILGYILNVKWQEAYRSEESMINILEKIGFHNIKIFYDRQKMFPTIIGER